MACPDASAAIHECVLAIKAHVTVDVLAETIHAFPSTSRILNGLFAEARARLRETGCPRLSRSPRRSGARHRSPSTSTSRGRACHSGAADLDRLVDRRGRQDDDVRPMPGHQPAPVRLARADRRVDARGPDRPPQRQCAAPGPSGGGPGRPRRRGAGHGAGDAGPRVERLDRARRSRTRRPRPRASRAASGKARRSARSAPTGAAPSRRPSGGGPAAPTRRCRARRTGRCRRRRPAARARRGASAASRRPSAPRASSAARTAASPIPWICVAMPSDAAARRLVAPGASGVVSQTPCPSLGGAGSPGDALHRLEQGGGPRAERAVGERLEPAEAQAVRAGRARAAARCAAPASPAASSCSARMLAWTRSPRSPAAASAPVGLERAAEIVARGQAARVVDGDDAQRDELPGARAGRRPRSLGRRRRRDERRRRGASPTRGGRRSGCPASSRRITPPCGSERRSSIPASARARALTSSAWWSWAQSATRRPGAARSRSAAVGQRPSVSGSQPPPSIQPSLAGASAAAARTRVDQLVDRPRSPRAPTREPASAASTRWRCASVRPGDRDLVVARGRARRVPGPGERPRRRRAIPPRRPARRRSRSPRPSPGPSAPASVAILPTTTRSAREASSRVHGFRRVLVVRGEARAPGGRLDACVADGAAARSSGGGRSDAPSIRRRRVAQPAGSRTAADDRQQRRTASRCSRR